MDIGVESMKLLKSLTRKSINVDSENALATRQQGMLQEVEKPTIVIPSQFHPERKLSHYLFVGRTYHDLCRNTFVEKVQHGYYAYERWFEWRTCAVAAAYAGAFGASSIEHPEFSYSMAVWRLSQLVGYDIGKYEITDPTGRTAPVAEAMIKLVDENYWNRIGVFELLVSKGL